MSKIFPVDICGIIADYAAKYQLLDWLNKEQFISNSSYILYENPNAVDMIADEIAEFANKPFRDMMLSIHINWTGLSANPSAIKLLEANPDRIDYQALSGNPSAIKLLLSNKSKIHWDALSTNKNAIEILKENPDKIKWNYLSANESAIDLLKENPDKIDWMVLSGNSQAVPYLLEHPDKILYGQADNRNTNGLEIFKKQMRERPDSINWALLSMNPAAIEILKENPDKINYMTMQQNKGAFEPKRIPQVYEILLNLSTL